MKVIDGIKRPAMLRWSVFVFAILLVFLPAMAQEPEDEKEEKKNEEPAVVEQITVTGSRILKNPLNELAPITEVEKEDLEVAGLTNIGAVLQRLPMMGSAINTRFNVPGNSGFPQDGNGIGAGAVQLALRNTGAKRTLVLVDGKRWIPGASASGVPIAVDLNTLPASAIKKVEVLQDGASAIYGSDAIGGVVNIITHDTFKGFKFNVQNGEFLEYNDGRSSEVSALWGGGNDKTHIIMSVSYAEEGTVETFDRDQSAYPSPFGQSCLDGGCSSFTPQGRFILGPVYDYADMALNDGVFNNGGSSIPSFDPNNPYGGDFHAFSSADRFNFNGPGYNYLATPNERINLFTKVRHQISENVRFLMTAAYTNRQSNTKGAPEPLCFGAGCGNRIADNIVIDADQIYNPFGVDLSVAAGTLEFFGRRPLESGPRIFEQDVNTYFGNAGFEGEFFAGEKIYHWDVNASYGDNRGFQQKYGAHNMAKLAVALGDPQLCAATPGCVPFNIFGGQGPDGNGSITQEMLDFVGYTQRDYSRQTLFDVAANITGDLILLENGKIAFAAGAEYREHEGSYQPDDIAARGETAGIASGPTNGKFDVTEYYAEFSMPLELQMPGADFLELSVAGRVSDYSSFGSEDTYKVGGMWRPIHDLSVRATYSTGIRAPGIGELFGGAAREDFNFLDPCADVTGILGAANGGRDVSQPQNIIDNCATLGILPGVAQRNPQLSAVSAGNENLKAETSKNYSFGIVYNPEWVKSSNWTDGLTMSLDFYDLTIDDAVQGRSPAEIITACVDTLDPVFCNGVQRTAGGVINLVDNQLQNIGGIEASGYDIGIRYMGPESRAGRFGANFSATMLSDYTELTINPDKSLTSIDRTGTITNETFQRAFPEQRWNTTINWDREMLSADLVFRYIDDMIQTSGNTLDSVIFTDLQFRVKTAVFGNDLAILLGCNNILDEDPPVCDSCGTINMSPVVHDIPGRSAYLRLSLMMN